jgi:hypothetical protein
MICLFVVWLDAQGLDARDPKRLDGRWASTVVPPKGEAPMIAAHLQVQASDDRVVVTIGDDPTARTATVYPASRTSSHLIVQFVGPRGDKRMVILRPENDGMRVEYFVEQPGRPTANYFYSELFARAKK